MTDQSLVILTGRLKGRTPAWPTHIKADQGRMQIDDARLRFPVLTISRHGDVEIMRDRAMLGTSNSIALGRDHHKGMLLIDGTGRSFTVSATTETGPAAPLWGLRFMRPRQMRVSLDLTPGSSITLDDTKRLTVEAIRRHPDVWEAIGDLREIEHRINSTRTFAELVEVLT